MKQPMRLSSASNRSDASVHLGPPPRCIFQIRLLYADVPLLLEDSLPKASLLYADVLLPSEDSLCKPLFEPSPPHSRSKKPLCLRLIAGFRQFRLRLVANPHPQDFRTSPKPRRCNHLERFLLTLSYSSKSYGSKSTRRNRVLLPLCGQHDESVGHLPTQRHGDADFTSLPDEPYRQAYPTVPVMEPAGIFLS